MNEPSNELQDWDRCDAGMLVSLSGRAKSARRRRQALRAGAVALAAFVAVGLGMWGAGVWSGPREYYFGGIACHEVQENMDAMMAGTLPGELQARIGAHLRECPVCQDRMREGRSGSQSQALGFGRPDGLEVLRIAAATNRFPVFEIE